jgi:hypothetical protein
MRYQHAIDQVPAISLQKLRKSGPKRGRIYFSHYPQPSIPVEDISIQTLARLFMMNL